MAKQKYNGFYIVQVEDGSFDITELNSDLVDGGFKSVDECKAVIDLFDPHPSRAADV